MKNAVIYFGSLRSAFAAAQDWTPYSIAIIASDGLEVLSPYRQAGLRVFAYTHRHDDHFSAKLASDENDGLFLDWATPPAAFVENLCTELHRGCRRLIVNTGWGANTQVDYGPADMLMVESFIGTNSGDDGRWPVVYSRRDRHVDEARVRTLRQHGYEVMALTYGHAEDRRFAEHCRTRAAAAGASYFLYSQAPGWEMEGSGFRFHAF